MSPISHIEDRWFRTVTADGRQVKQAKARNGTGLRWRVRYDDPDGNERSASFAKKSDADRFRTQVDADILRGTYRDPEAGRITLRKYAAEWLAIQTFDTVTREMTETRIRLHILPRLGDRRLDELAARPTLIAAWLSSLTSAQGRSRGLALSSAGKVLMTLKSILSAAVTDMRITSNPCNSRQVKLPKALPQRVKPWTLAQAAAVRAELPARYAAVVDAGTGLGLRQSEIFGLGVAEVDFLRRSVLVCRQVKLIGGRLHFALPKHLRERDVPLASHTAEALAAHLAEFPAVSVTLPWHQPGNRRHGSMVTADLLFTSRDGRALVRHGFNGTAWRPAVKAAGLAADRENGCHAMRHLFASALIAAGVDVRTVAAYLGHADNGALVLKTYSHLMPDAEDRTRRALEAAFAVARDAPDAVSGQP